MKNKIDPVSHVGETHGIYTLVDVLDEKNKYGQYIYKGVCNICGYVKFSHYGDFSGSKSIVTVCKHVDASGRYTNPTSWGNKRIRHIFQGMKNRCYRQNDKDYKHYGGKGICICDEWLDDPSLFEEWAVNNGYQDDLTIDRIDEDQGYCQDNCRWVTISDNAKYNSTTSMIEVNGEVHSGHDWARILGLGQNRINTYVRQYGLDNTKKFIELYRNNPTLKPKGKQSYYDLYMQGNDISV